MASKILQIIPAGNDWFIEISKEGKNPWYRPVACWALVEEEDGSRYVIPMQAGDLCLEPVEQATTPDIFMSIYHRSEMEEDDD